MNKKLLIPLIIFLAVAAAFLVQLGRNAQGDDPKALESALVGKPVPQKTLTDLLENKTYGNEIFQQCVGNLVSNLLCRASILESIG